MMWKDKGYMASGEKLVSLSLNTFCNVSKVFGHASKMFSHASKAFSHASKVFNKFLVKGCCSINGIFTINDMHNAQCTSGSSNIA